MAKATSLRNAEKSKNQDTIADTKGALVAVAQALTVLKESNAKAAEATKGMGAESGGVVGVLEVIESDLARLATDTDAVETATKEEYDIFMHSKVDKTGKASSIEHTFEVVHDSVQH